MTREEAIYQIKQLSVLSTDKEIPKITEALDMAIEALQRQTDGDLISRADAMRIVHSAIEAEIPFAIVADLIKGLPSAEAAHKPDYSYEADMVRRLKESPSAELPKGDLISRADAVAYPLGFDHYDKENGSREFICGVESYREYIQHLPSVSAERVGEWIPLDGKLPKIIGHHVLVTIKWADDDLEVCEMCPTVADRYNIIAFQDLPEPYQGEQSKSELQCSGARMKGGTNG